MSENDASTVTSWPATTVVPFMPAPRKYGTTATVHRSLAGVCATAGVAVMTVNNITRATSDVLFMRFNQSYFAASSFFAVSAPALAASTWVPAPIAPTAIVTLWTRPLNALSPFL